MKKISPVITAFCICIVFVLLQFGCKKEIHSQDSNSQSSGVSVLPTEDTVSVSGSSRAVILTSGTGPFTCGSDIYNTAPAGTTGFYNYPDATIDLTNLGTGRTVTLVCDYKQVPNYISVYNAQGTQVATTGWVGQTNHSGPWGSSLHTAPTPTITFTKSATTSIYTLKVATSITDTSDAYEIHVYCTGGPSCPAPCSNPIPPMCYCGSNFSGTFTTLHTFYQYPDNVMHLDCIQPGKTVFIQCNPNDIPDLFTVYDAAGNQLANSGWLGHATYPGPWGNSSPSNPLNVPPKQISFVTNSSTTYILRVATLTAPNGSYSPATDSWNASVGCP
jgi:hypothetical protein